MPTWNSVSRLPSSIVEETKHVASSTKQTTIGASQEIQQTYNSILQTAKDNALAIVLVPSTSITASVLLKNRGFVVRCLGTAFTASTAIYCCYPRETMQFIHKRINRQYYPEKERVPTPSERFVKLNNSVINDVLSRPSDNKE
uniref:Uncharacterized protein n=1 Tax=Vannella robusta TaxID=1487602 RepID=A0A7S4HHA8_9EUKA|mmetsp:Transcript_10473/g.12941  ORF Transcript_10473/g.12941 Transcript_10473/m.12941 type:complete len:143 (+) Transcript_10473:143-571(+)